MSDGTTLEITPSTSALCTTRCVGPSGTLRVTRACIRGCETAERMRARYAIHTPVPLSSPPSYYPMAPIATPIPVAPPVGAPTPMSAPTPVWSVPRYDWTPAPVATPMTIAPSSWDWHPLDWLSPPWWIWPLGIILVLVVLAKLGWLWRAIGMFILAAALYNNPLIAAGLAATFGVVYFACRRFPKFRHFLAASCAFVTAFIRYRPTIRRAASSLHGDADWMDINAAAKHFSTGGLIIGEAYRPDLRPNGGKAPLLRFDGNSGSGHILVIAGSGGYKTTGVVVPSALEWPSTLVCLDPSGDVARLTYQARRELGHRVVVLDPDQTSDSFNALDWIDTRSDRAISDIQSIVTWLCGELPDTRYRRDGDYFDQAGRDLLSCLLADILFDTGIQPQRKTLALLRQRLTRPIPILKTMLKAIIVKPVGYGFAAQHAAALADLPDKQFAGLYGSATTATSWLAVPSLARLVCGDSFHTRHLLSGHLDVFINLPLKTLEANPQVGRIILGSLLQRVYEARGQMAGRCLFLLDEVARLGYMSLLETARDTGRKYAINLCLLFQSAGQLAQTWGESGRQAWMDGSYIRCFSHIQDFAAAEMVSQACGEYTAWADSTTEGSSKHPGSWFSGSHKSSGEHQVARRLIKADEIMRLRDTDSGSPTAMIAAQPTADDRSVALSAPSVVRPN